MKELSTPADRRTRKRLVTRQTISNVATRLFMERGFDAVTIDEIAHAADVGRMTVFNHFPRKEDMFFDLDDEGREILRDALRNRAADEPPIDTLRMLAQRLIAERQPFVDFSARSQSFVETVRASETLKARARAIRDELADLVAAGLADSVGQEPGDAAARLAANLLLAIWSTAFVEAHAIFRRTRKTKDANAAFLAMIDRGSIGLAAAMAGTPYA